MQKTLSRYDYLTKTPVPKLICTLAIPTIISMLVTGIYNAADTYFVGRISTQATAAVGLVFSVMAIVQAFGFFCGHGSGNYISRKLGAGDPEEASVWFINAHQETEAVLKADATGKEPIGMLAKCYERLAKEHPEMKDAFLKMAVSYKAML